MAQESLRSAPATLMLMGEHAVLQKKHAIACAVNKRIHVRMKKRDDDQIIIHSSLGSYSSEQNKADPRFSFVLACLEHAPHGVELTIESDFSHKVGLGSSAAVCVATLAHFYEGKELFDRCLEVVRKVQGRGSGADIAASIFGGVVLYKMEPPSIEKLADTLPLSLVYSGSKMPTKDVIDKVLKAQEKEPEIFSQIFDAMDKAVLQAQVAIQNNDLETLGRLFNIHHGLQDALGTCNEPLALIVKKMQLNPEIFGAKISGSGLGDCSVALGKMSFDIGYEQIPIEVSKEGVL